MNSKHDDQVIGVFSLTVFYWNYDYINSFAGQEIKYLYFLLSAEKDTVWGSRLLIHI